MAQTGSDGALASSGLGRQQRGEALLRRQQQQQERQRLRSWAETLPGPPGPWHVAPVTAWGDHLSTAAACLPKTLLVCGR